MSPGTMLKRLGPVATAALLTAGCSSTVDDMGETLEQGFIVPPNGASPRVWWHWMNGNITTDGIKKDLEWMHRVGIGGFQNFDAALNAP